VGTPFGAVMPGRGRLSALSAAGVTWSDSRTSEVPVGRRRNTPTAYRDERRRTSPRAPAEICHGTRPSVVTVLPAPRRLRSRSGEFIRCAGCRAAVTPDAAAARHPTEGMVAPMGVMKRVTMVFRAKANKALDRMEDPRETLDYSYQTQLELLQKV